MPWRDVIITSPTAEKMLKRVSPIYDDSYVGLWIFQAIGIEYDQLWDIINSFPDQLFPETATWTIELWERRYGIVPVEGQSLETRRQRVLAMRSTPKPLNPFQIESYIRIMYERDCEVVDNVGSYTFGVYIIATDTPKELNVRDIIAYLDRHKPSHMSYELAFEAATAIRISIETGFWRIPYRMSGDAYAGQLPYPTIDFKESDGEVLVSGIATPYKFPYTMAGTKPDISTTYAKSETDVEVASEAQPFVFSYPHTGDSKTGVIPDYSITTDAESASIQMAAEGSAYSIPYSMCGTKYAATDAH